jgi:D-alanyl-lipoteichoic acid acyltransferase DltB (MBOAT superfamily)
MIFNSYAFFGFFVIVFTAYWLLQNKLRWQNTLLLIASYFFYGYWDYRFVFLLAFSTFLDYYTGLKIHNATSKGDKKKWVVISLSINLGFLFVFKYYNFFIESFAVLLTSFGFEPHLPVLQILLPVGISFYTFHGISYVMDIYYGRITPTRNVVDYSVFVSFFPLLVAGPIERASHLLPQVHQPRKFKYLLAVDGLRDVLWGLFKKVAVADLCSDFADKIFKGGSEQFGGSTLALGVFLFSMQIYGDFSGYSDIARGIGKMLGFDLIRNFSYPYFSRDIAEFWRRWHISLSSWFRDYVYIPLGGSRGTKTQSIRNTFIVFLLSGFWHGANWTFIIWGALHAIFFLPLLLTNRNRSNLEIVAVRRRLPTIREVFNIATTFALVCFAWIFFRADSLSGAISMIKGIFSKSLLSRPSILPSIPIAMIGIMLLFEWMGREDDNPLRFTSRWPLIFRWILYVTLVMLIFLMFRRDQSFIYFQF